MLGKPCCPPATTPGGGELEGPGICSMSLLSWDLLSVNTGKGGIPQCQLCREGSSRGAPSVCPAGCKGWGWSMWVPWGHGEGRDPSSRRLEHCLPLPRVRSGSTFCSVPAPTKNPVAVTSLQSRLALGSDGWGLALSPLGKVALKELIVWTHWSMPGG